MVARSPSASSTDLSGKSDANVIIAAMLEKTSRHLFGPTSAPASPPKQQVVSLTALKTKLSYLKSSEIKLVRQAFHFADQAHLGQYRQSGEPYITHPLAVAELCADWRLDVYSIMSALLEDVNGYGKRYSRYFG